MLVVSTVDSLLLKVFQSVLDNNPAVTLAAEAKGMLSVCMELVELHAGAVPPVAGVAKVCVAAVSPFKDVMALEI